MSNQEAAEIWTSWMQNQLSARYPAAAGYRVVADGERVRVLDENGRVRNEWNSNEEDFVGHLFVAVDPTLRESFWAKLRRRFFK